jgi:L-alanine-DL-glutamate epimerase-like enolase superfamily enzyme
MELIIRTFDLKLQHTFSISRKINKYTTPAIVELRWEGISGYGEATSNPYYNITIDNIVADLEK